jgi:hypothetical protein
MYIYNICKDYQFNHLQALVQWYHCTPIYPTTHLYGSIIIPIWNSASLSNNSCSLLLTPGNYILLSVHRDVGTLGTSFKRDSYDICPFTPDLFLLMSSRVTWNFLFRDWLMVHCVRFVYPFIHWRITGSLPLWGRCATASSDLTLLRTAAQVACPSQPLSLLDTWYHCRTTQGRCCGMWREAHGDMGSKQHTPEELLIGAHGEHRQGQGTTS